MLTTHVAAETLETLYGLDYLVNDLIFVPRLGLRRLLLKRFGHAAAAGSCRRSSGPGTEANAGHRLSQEDSLPPAERRRPTFSPTLAVELDLRKVSTWDVADRGTCGFTLATPR